jgi:prevent-host-death family protein
MTRNIKTTPSKKTGVQLPSESSWALQDAKARFSEVVRRARSEGPQHVTVHGREEVVVLSAEEFRRLRSKRSGAEIVAALQVSPYREVDIAPTRGTAPVRDISL